MKHRGLKAFALVVTLLFIPGAISSNDNALTQVEKKLVQVEKQLKELSTQLAQLRKTSSGPKAGSQTSVQAGPQQVEVVKTYLEVSPDPQVRDSFFRTIYLLAKVRVQNVWTQPSRDVVIYAACPDCNELGWRPVGDLDKLSGTVKYLAPSDKEEISLTLAAQTVGSAQRYDGLKLPKAVLVRVHEGGCKETTCPIEVVSSNNILPVVMEGERAGSLAEPFYRKRQ